MRKMNIHTLFNYLRLNQSKQFQFKVSNKVRYVNDIYVSLEVRD